MPQHTALDGVGRKNQTWISIGISRRSPSQVTSIEKRQRSEPTLAWKLVRATLISARNPGTETAIGCAIPRTVALRLGSGRPAASAAASRRRTNGAAGLTASSPSAAQQTKGADDSPSSTWLKIWIIGGESQICECTFGICPTG